MANEGKHTPGPSHYRIFNLDRINSAAFGGMPSEHDAAQVYDTAQTGRPNPLTGEARPLLVFAGTLAEAHAWIAQQGVSE